MGNHHKLNRKCITCNCDIYDKNKSGYCSKHRDRTGINNPFYGKTHTKETMDRIKKKNSITFKKLWKTKEYYDKVVKAVSKPRSEIGKQNMSIAAKKSYEKFPELRIQRGELMKKYWKEGLIVKNNYSCNKSKKQTQLFNELKQLFPNNKIEEDITIKYDDKWLFPDIVVSNLNIVVEYNGDYWHANPKQYKSTDLIKGNEAKNIWKRDKFRKQILNKLGYDVITVWQNDYLKDKQKVFNKIKKIINEKRI